jgi:hypothetical protein
MLVGTEREISKFGMIVGLMSSRLRCVKIGSLTLGNVVCSTEGEAIQAMRDVATGFDSARWMLELDVPIEPSA